MIDRHEAQSNILFRSWLVVLLAVATMLWGLGAVYGTLAAAGNWEHFLTRQAVWALGAFAAAMIAWRVPFDFLLRFAGWLALAGFGLLLLLPWFGIRINGMLGWYEFHSVMIQPSELVKGVYLLLLVRLLSAPERTEWLRVVTALPVMAGFVGTILLQPDWGTALVFAAGGLGALYFCRIRWRYLWGLAGLAALSMGGVILRHPYMLRRILSFFDSSFDPAGAGWHQRQFAIAIARGEWFGVKGEMAVWSAGFLPLSHNDSIFAGMSEMLGAFGAGLLVFLLAAWFWQFFRLGSFCSDPVRRSYIDAAAAMILFQALLHIYVNLGLLPPTGITLPLVSYGGSSMLGTMLMLGFALAAARKQS